MPLLMVIVPSTVRELPELSVELDGAPLLSADWGARLLVEPGDHTAAGHGAREIAGRDRGAGHLPGASR
ncbi:MAG: hypothetical protein U0359_03380 [Byssovorax sp.]